MTTQDRPSGFFRPATGHSLPLLAAVLVVLESLAGCSVDGTEKPVPDAGGATMAAEEGNTGPGEEPDGRETEAGENGTELPDSGRDTANSPEHRGSSAVSGPSRGVFRGAAPVDRDAEARLLQEQMRLRAQIDTLDRTLTAFDRNPPSRAAREADARGRPETIERRLDLERSLLKAREREIDRELRHLHQGRTPPSFGSDAPDRSSQGLFGSTGRP